MYYNKEAKAQRGKPRSHGHTPKSMELDGGEPRCGSLCTAGRCAGARAVIS